MLEFTIEVCLGGGDQRALTLPFEGAAIARQVARNIIEALILSGSLTQGYVAVGVNCAGSFRGLGSWSFDGDAMPTWEDDGPVLAPVSSGSLRQSSSPSQRAFTA